jgi:LmbE family N-acetylglucosaminyl deacetylase
LKHIYISPHADDVALSCGGQILANPSRHTDSMVVTVFTSQGNPASQGATGGRARFRDSVHTDREIEDEAAWNSVDVPLHQMRLPEALLRGSFPFSPSRNARDRDVMAELQDALSSYMRSFPEARFYFPAGIGRHLDHMLCRDVAVNMLARKVSAKIAFYEDAPYWWLRFLRSAHYRELGLVAAVSNTAKDPRSPGVGLLRYLFRREVPFPRGRKLFFAVYLALLAGAGRGMGSPLKGLSPTITMTTLDDQILRSKRTLVQRYESQLPMLFGRAPDGLLEDYRDCFATERVVEFLEESASSAAVNDC